MLKSLDNKAEELEIKSEFTREIGSPGSAIYQGLAAQLIEVNRFDLNFSHRIFIKSVAA